jgi:16S rRNA (guanine(966)-N(2))-methyltransferase RsmD
MRVIGGTARGRRLLAPRGLDTRPTSDKVKEALFSILAGMIGPLDGSSVLDVFAGTGSLGIEAMSRGAGQAVFIDAGRVAVTVLAKNLQTTGFADRSTILTQNFRAAFTRLESAGRNFRIVFLDPPYGKGLLEKSLEQLSESTMLDEGAVVVAEHSSREEIRSAFGPLRQCDRRVYGDTALTFFTLTRKGSP